MSQRVSIALHVKLWLCLALFESFVVKTTHSINELACASGGRSTRFPKHDLRKQLLVASGASHSRFELFKVVIAETSPHNEIGLEPIIPEI